MTNSIHERKPTSSGKPPVSFRNSSLPISGDIRSRLGVVMIVKNEEKNIGSLLEDIKGIFDEVVVVDTGSPDRTLEILRSYGVNIGHFNWCDDFSAARNKSIELAVLDYLLWLDADDRIDADAGKAILAGMILTSVAVKDTEALLLAFEEFMRSFGMDTDKGIDGIASRDRKSLRGLRKAHARAGHCTIDAYTIAEAAIMINPSCWNAHLLTSDVYRINSNK